MMKVADATKAALAVLVILVVAALVGARVLQVFGVSLDAFSVAGGGVLAWIGFSMLRGNSGLAPDPSKEGADEKRSITPLVLFAASPGTRPRRAARTLSTSNAFAFSTACFA